MDFNDGFSICWPSLRIRKAGLVVIAIGRKAHSLAGCTAMAAYGVQRFLSAADGGC